MVAKTVARDVLRLVEREACKPVDVEVAGDGGDGSTTSAVNELCWQRDTVSFAAGEATETVIEPARAYVSASVRGGRVLT